MEQEILAACKKCGSSHEILIEYDHGIPEHYDGISEIDCLDCGAHIGRWSGKELEEEEKEKRFGQNMIKQ